MQVGLGRVERRVTLAFLVRLSDPRSQDPAEKATTENVSVSGVRLFAKRAFFPKQSLLIASANGEVHGKARVVYCQQIAQERFALGLQLEGGTAERNAPVNWWSALKRGEA